MARNTQIRLFTLALLASIAACGPKIVEDPEVMPRFSELATRCHKWMVGSFVSERQGAEPGMSLHQCSIWPTETGGLWVYSEQVITDRSAPPVHQTIYRITDDLYGGVLLQCYDLPGNARTFAGGWREPGFFNQIDPYELTLRGSCGLHLKRTGDGSLAGGTEGTDCASSRSGASYMTESLDLGSMEIRSWRRGFDADGVQVWGGDAAIVFERSNASARPESIKPGSDHTPDIGPYTPRKSE